MANGIASTTTNNQRNDRLFCRRRRTNRWIGATGSDFRIKRDPAKLLGGAVARSTQTFGILRSRTMGRMKPHETFALALRVIGVLIVAYGARYVIDFGLGLLGYFSLQRTSYAYYLIIGFAYLCVGLYFLRGARLIVRFAYPNVDDDDNDDRLDSSDDAEQIVGREPR
jgi:hypothetical protein